MFNVGAHLCVAKDVTWPMAAGELFAVCSFSFFFRCENDYQVASCVILCFCISGDFKAASIGRWP